MKQALSIGKTLLDTVDSAAGIVPKLSMDSLIILIALIVAGAFIGILGLKLIRLFAGAAGLCAGAVIGMIVSDVIKLSSITEIIVLIICAVVVAAISAYFARVGTFFLVFFYGMVICTHFLDGWKDSKIILLICLGVPFLVALISAILYAPAVILISGVTGGIMIGYAVVTLGGKADVLWMLAGMCAGFSVICMMIQILINRGRSHSRRRDEDEEEEEMIPKKSSKRGKVVDEADDEEDDIVRVDLDDEE